jgi:hypothetical protein
VGISTSDRVIQQWCICLLRAGKRRAKASANARMEIVIVDSDDSGDNDSRPGPSSKRHWAAERKVNTLCHGICTLPRQLSDNSYLACLI